MSRFIKSSSAYTSDNIDGPERRLFIAVISQAVHDAFSKHVPPLEKQKAQSWLMSNSEDFRDICWAALGEWDCLKEDSNSILGFDEKLEEMKKYPHQDNHMD